MQKEKRFETNAERQLDYVVTTTAIYADKAILGILLKAYYSLRAIILINLFLSLFGI